MLYGEYNFVSENTEDTFKLRELIIFGFDQIFYIFYNISKFYLHE